MTTKQIGFRSQLMQRLRHRIRYVAERSGLRSAVQNTLSSIALGLATPMAWALNRLVPGNQAYSLFERQGFHLLRKHYYLPIPDQLDLQDPLVNTSSQLVGIDMNDAEALKLLKDVIVPNQQEFRESFPLHPDGSNRFHLINGGFMAGDAHVYYALIRHMRPSRIIEIGGGNSSLLAAAACLRNLQEYGVKPHLTVIEPFPGEQLIRGVAGIDQLIAKRVQEVDLSLFSSLRSGDICFIDSTHVLRPGGDVHYEYCELLPRLAPGVMVHIHDISLPKPYFSFYFENHLYWNEQYLLQAYLTHNSRIKVLWPGTYMFEKYRIEVMAAFPEITEMRKKFPLAEPSSFWMQVTGD